jgi:hypothetical protein
MRNAYLFVVLVTCALLLLALPKAHAAPPTPWHVYIMIDVPGAEAGRGRRPTFLGGTGPNPGHGLPRRRLSRLICDSPES